MINSRQYILKIEITTNYNSIKEKVLNILKKDIHSKHLVSDMK